MTVSAVYRCDGPECDSRSGEISPEPYPSFWERVIDGHDQYDFCGRLCLLRWASKQKQPGTGEVAL